MTAQLLIGAAIAAVPVSCVKSELTQNGRGELITFKSIASDLTKAGGTGLPATVDMGVQAQFTNGGEYFPLTVFKNNEATGKIWASPTPKYWPISGTLDFTVFTPFTPKSAYSKLEISTGSISAEGVSATDDFLYGDMVYTASRTKGSVPVLLRHAQSLVCFNAQADIGGLYEIISIKLERPTVKGNVQISYAEVNKVDKATVKWTPTAVDENGIVFNPQASDFAGTDTGKLTVKNKTYNIGALNTGLIIPDNQTSFTVKYKMRGVECVPITFNFRQPKWESGKKYTYNIFFKANEIRFDSSVMDWNTDGEAESFIPKRPMTINVSSPSGRLVDELGVTVRDDAKFFITNEHFHKLGNLWTSYQNWPVTRPLDFAVYYPWKARASFTEKTITCPDINQDIDFLYGEKLYLDQPSGHTVDVRMNHAKCKIILKIDNSQVNNHGIRSVWFSNIKKSGTAKIDYSTDPASLTWTGTNGTDVNKILIESWQNDVSFKKKSLYYIPDSPEDQLKKTLTVVVSSNTNTNTEDVLTTTNIEVPDTWEAGKIYRYKVLRGENDLIKLEQEGSGNWN